MTNLTITVDEELLKRARIRAIEQGTSVNAVLRNFLESYSGVQQVREQGIRALLQLSQKAQSRRGSSIWSREELHDR
jgi:plasmid stability protein